MDFIIKCFFFGEIRRAWNGTGMKWVRHELSIWGLNWDGHEMAWHEMGPAWTGTGMKWDTRAWNGTGMKWDWHEMAQSGMKWDGHEMGRHEMVRHEMAGMKWGWFPKSVIILLTAKLLYDFFFNFEVRTLVGTWARHNVCFDKKLTHENTKTAQSAKNVLKNRNYLRRQQKTILVSFIVLWS